MLALSLSSSMNRLYKIVSCYFNWSGFDSLDAFRDVEAVKFLMLPLPAPLEVLCFRVRFRFLTFGIFCFRFQLRIKLVASEFASASSIFFFFLHCPLFREGCGGSSSRLSRHTSRSSITSIISLGRSPKQFHPRSSM